MFGAPSTNLSDLEGYSDFEDLSSASESDMSSVTPSSRIATPVPSIPCSSPLPNSPNTFKRDSAWCFGKNITLRTVGIFCCSTCSSTEYRLISPCTVRQMRSGSASPRTYFFSRTTRDPAWPFSSREPFRAEPILCSSTTFSRKSSNYTCRSVSPGMLSTTGYFRDLSLCYARMFHK